MNVNYLDYVISKENFTRKMKIIFFLNFQRGLRRMKYSDGCEQRTSDCFGWGWWYGQ